MQTLSVSLLLAWIVTIRRRPTPTGDVVWCWHRTHLNTTDYWLGLYKDTATPLGTTTWMDRSPSTYRNWAKTYPKHQAKCVVYTKDGFKDERCNASFYYTCKKASPSNRVLSCDVITTLSCRRQTRAAPRPPDVFYTKVDADKLATDNCCDGWRAVAKFSKSGVWNKVPEGSSLIFGDTSIPFRHSVGAERSLYTRNQLDAFRTRTCDGQTDGHTVIANTALAKRRARKNVRLDTLGLQSFV